MKYHIPDMAVVLKLDRWRKQARRTGWVHLLTDLYRKSPKGSGYQGQQDKQWPLKQTPCGVFFVLLVSIFHFLPPCFVLFFRQTYFLFFVKKHNKFWSWRNV